MAVLEAAVRTGTMLEINANPDRRDLNELHARDAAAAGIPLVINCDAHRIGGFEVVRYGVATARRAWLTPSARLRILRGGGRWRFPPPARRRPAA